MSQSKTADGARPRLTKERVGAWLRSRFMLRLHMFWIVGGTYLAGVVATKLLDDAGFHSMPWRYLTAVVLAYLAFLGLIRLWLWYVGAMAAPDVDVDVDDEAVEFCADLIMELRPGFLDAPLVAAQPVQGGSFGGGGSSGSWGDGVAQNAVSTPSSGGGFSFDFDGEELLIVALVLAVVLSLVAATIYVVYAAPVILAEAAFEAALAAALTRSAKRVDTPGWVGRVWRATVWPFAIVAVLTVALGWVAQNHCPAAHRLVDAIDCAQPRTP